MANKITYLDYRGQRINIIWFKADPSILDDYQDRVLQDDGTIEAMQCVRDIWTADEQDYTFECASTHEPLSYRWHGDDRYQPVRGSEITFRVLIKNDEEAALMADLLNGGYYVNVTVNHKNQWIGKLFPEFYSEAYKQYPYTLEINASDQLGQLKETQPLMIDYPEPWPSSNTNLLQFINKLLTDDGIKPSADFLTAPEELRSSIRMYEFGGDAGKLLENVYIDPLVFIDEDDQYASKYDILTTVLEPLHCFIMQWDARWWIVSYDAMWDAGKIWYQNYLLNYENGATYQYDETDGSDILDLYELQNDTNPVTRQLYNDAQMNYLPSWRKVTIQQKFVKNTNLLNAFTNKTGRFYYGSEGIQLEFNADGNRLRHWTYYGGNYPTAENNENDGFVKTTYFQKNYSNPLYIYKEIDLPAMDYDGFNINLHLSTNSITQDYNIDTGAGTEFNIEIKYEIDNSDWWYWNNDNHDGAGGSFPGWNDGFRLFRTGMGTLNLDTRLPHKDISQSGKLTIAIWPALSSAIYPDDYLLYTGLTVSLVSEKWTSLEYEIESNFEIYNRATKLQVDKEFTWGISNPNDENYHERHLSSPYDRAGDPIRYFKKDGVEFVGRPLMSWLQLNYFDDNSTVTPQLTGKFRSRYITPFRLVYDYEDRVYGWTNASYQSRSGVWNMTYTQYNAVRNLPEKPVKCDFSTFDFNNDFCTEIASGYLFDYIVRVTGDGGTVEAASCVQDAINNLT